MIKVESEEKIRIDNYLTNKLDLSRSKIQKLIKDGNILFNAYEIYKINEILQLKNDFKEYFFTLKV